MTTDDHARSSVQQVVSGTELEPRSCSERAPVRSGVGGTLLRDAVASDFAYIDTLRKKEGSALGFMPKDAYLSVLERRRVSNRDRWKYQRL